MMIGISLLMKSQDLDFKSQMTDFKRRLIYLKSEFNIINYKAINDI